MSSTTGSRIEPNARVRVLVVDDSAFARKVLREVLSAHPRIEIVGTARDGLEALELIGTLKPDVVTLDLLMPNLDGLSVLRALPDRKPPCVVVSVTESDSERALEALEAGAIDLIHKPTALATSRLYDLSAEVVEKVLAAAQARVPIRAATLPPVAILPPHAAAVEGSKRVVVVGTSTGGPAALRTLIPAIPSGFPLPVVVALHIPAGYTESLARRLNVDAQIEVVEGSEGMALKPGVAMICPGGQHATIGKNGLGEPVLRVSDDLHALHSPSIDALFASAAEVFGARTLGVVLTGMGSDGLEGSRKIAACGGAVLCESEQTAVIYGMPRVVWEAQLAEAQGPLDTIAELILKHAL